MKNRILPLTMGLATMLFARSPLLAQDDLSFAEQLKQATTDSAQFHVLNNWALSIMATHPDTAIILFASAAERARQGAEAEKDARLKNVLRGYEATAYSNQGIIYCNQDDFETGMPYVEKASRILVEIGDDEAMANMHALLAQSYYKKGDFAEAISQVKKSISIWENSGNKEGVVAGLNNLGFYYSKSGNLPEAVEVYRRCLQLSDETGNRLGSGVSLMNIGVMLAKQGEVAAGIEYLEKSLKVLEEVNEVKWIASVLDNLGQNYLNTGQHDKALACLLKSVEAAKQVNARRILVNSYSRLGSYFSERNDLAESERYFTLASGLATEMGDKTAMSIATKGLGQLSLSKGDLAAAEKLGVESMRLAREAGQPEEIAGAAGLLKSLYARKGDYKKAYEYFEVFTQFNDSIKNDATRKAIIRAQMQFEYDKKESAMSAQHDKEIAVAAERARAQRLMLLLTGAGLLIALLAAVLAYTRFRVARRQKKLIEAQKAEVEHQKDIITLKNNENELLLSEIHHRVKNNLQVVSSLLSLQERDIDDKKAKTAIHEGRERIRSMELVHKLLYQNNRFTGIHMHDYVSKLTAGLLESFGRREGEFTLVVDVDPRLVLDADSAVPLGLILNELVVNALKHAGKKQDKLLLTVSLRETEEGLSLRVEDNGEGNATGAGSNSGSFGMRIVNALLRQLHGEMEVKSDRGMLIHVLVKNYKTQLHGD